MLQELHQRQANDVDPTLRFIDGRSFQPLAAELPYHQEEGPKGTVKLSNLHHRTGLRATTDEGEVTSLASARKTAPDTTISASQLRSAPRPEIPRASSPQQRSLGSYFTNFGVETGEFRRAVSVRKFPISVFAAPSNPETYLLSTETSSTMKFAARLLELGGVCSSIRFFCNRFMSASLAVSPDVFARLWSRAQLLGKLGEAGDD